MPTLCCGCGTAAADLIEELCGKCRKALGLPSTPIPVLRPPGPCQRCSHPEIIQSLVRERAASGADYVNAYAAPLAVSLGLTDVTTVFTGRKVGTTAALDEPHGLIVAYVCRRCGFTELYTTDAQQIPIGPEYGTRLLGEGEGGPYR
jgi:hypothetical protein